MKSRPVTSGMGKYDSESLRREQEFCLNALSSGDFDEMTDSEWIAMCEEVGSTKKKEAARKAAAEAAAAEGALSRNN